MKLPSPTVLASLSCSFLLAALPACQSASTTQANSLEPEREIKPIGDLVEATKKPQSIGMLLADLNSSIKAWNNLNLAGQTSKDQARARDIELHIQTVAHQRSADMRSNSSLLIAWLTEHGAKGTCELPAARMGLLDMSASVRTHSLMIMANRLDSESLQAIIDRLDDETTLVCGAATRAASYI